MDPLFRCLWEGTWIACKPVEDPMSQDGNCHHLQALQACITCSTHYQHFQEHLSLFQDSSHTQAEEYFGTWAVGKWRSDASHEKEVWRMISAWITLLFLRCEYKGNHPVGVPEFCTTLEPVGTSSKVVYKLEPEAQRDPHKIPHGNWKYIDEKMPQNQIQRSNLQKIQTFDSISRL